MSGRAACRRCPERGACGASVAMSPLRGGPLEGARLRVLSLGAGVQSTTLALMAAHREIGPMPDAAIFADTQWESPAVYEHLDWLASGNVLPFPVIRVTAGSLRDAIVGKATGGEGRFAAVPFYTADGGMGRRQCTREYKIDPIRKQVRAMLGLKPRQRGPRRPVVEQWIGISTDEIVRMKPAREAWAANRWPLVEANMSRADCLGWLRRHDYPIPPKSSCIGCPYHSDSYWRALRDRQPAAWDDAVTVDRLIRAKGPLRGMKQVQFMHRARKPLDQVDLTTAEDHGQLSFWGECEGLCGV